MYLPFPDGCDQFWGPHINSVYNFSQHIGFCPFKPRNTKANILWHWLNLAKAALILGVIPFYCGYRSISTHHAAPSHFPRVEIIHSFVADASSRIFHLTRPQLDYHFHCTKPQIWARVCLDLISHHCQSCELPVEYQQQSQEANSHAGSEHCVRSQVSVCIVHRRKREPRDHLCRQ